MYEDRDIKIAGAGSPGGPAPGALGISEEYNRERENGNISRAKHLGGEVAALVGNSGSVFPVDAEDASRDLERQKKILLSFAAVAGLELYCPGPATVYAAQNSFYSALEKTDVALYRDALGSGAFSFYYLAFRRGGDSERRIGQTFAMLCSHDGDPVYQELGEAIYCSFVSTVRHKAAGVGFVRAEGAGA